MATVSGVTNERIFSLKKWGGLNEAPDGDTRLKLGEASEMVNWKITRDGNLKRRPGTEFIADLNADYDVVVDGNIKMLQEIHDGDTFDIFFSASATAVPGTITLFGTGASIEQGLLTTYAATISDGQLQFLNEDAASITDGVLEIFNSFTRMTLETLQTSLDELGPGEYLYLWNNELPYAINQNSIFTDGTQTYLGGYLVTAEATSTDPVMGLWAGVAQNKEVLLAACGGKVWNLYDADRDVMVRTPLGDIDTSGKVTFFPFGGDVYILDGHEYYVYDGTMLSPVDGYIPIIAKQVGPVVNAQGDSDSGETTGEYVNRLTPYRRIWISPNGTNAVFQLPEKNIVWDDRCYVKDLGTGNIVSSSAYTVNAKAGQITFSQVPTKSVNRYEICYRAMSDAAYATMRQQATGNRFAELFSGPTDNMVYLYGDGTNRVLYSGMDDDGNKRGRTA